MTQFDLPCRIMPLLHFQLKYHPHVAAQCARLVALHQVTCLIAMKNTKGRKGGSRTLLLNDHYEECYQVPPQLQQSCETVRRWPLVTMTLRQSELRSSHQHEHY
jgi:hypothetical protein